MKPEWLGASNVSPRRRVRQKHRSWRCACGEDRPGYMSQCGACGKDRPT